MEISSAQIYALVLLILLISFIEGVESAYFSASRISIGLRKKQGKNSGRIWIQYFKHPTQFFSSSILLFNLFLTIYAIIWWNVLGKNWENWGIENVYGRMGITILTVTLTLLIFSFFNRAIFHARATAILNSGFVTGIVVFLFSISKKISMAIVHATEWILKYILNVNFNPNTEAFSKPDIDAFIANFRQLENHERLIRDNNIFENIMGLTNLKLRACLVPRREVIGIKEGVSIEEATRVIIETKLSRIVVYRETLDEIIGYIHQHDLFKNPKNVKSILLPLPMVPESMNVLDLIKKFSAEGKSIAWVVDEFGGTSGIITMENLLEQVFGEMNDEFDVKRNFLDQRISNNEYLLSGRLLLSEIKGKYHLKFTDTGEVETLSGFIIKRNGSIPRQNERIIIDNYQFDIISVTKTKIDGVKLIILR